MDPAIAARRALDRFLSRVSLFKESVVIAAQPRPWGWPVAAQSDDPSIQSDGIGRVVVQTTDLTHGREVKRLFQECRRILKLQPRRLTIDLTLVQKADTKLVGCLVRLYQLAGAASVTVEMILPHSVENILAVCRLEQLIEQTKPAQAPRVKSADDSH